MTARLLRALTILLLAGCRPGEQRGAPLFKLLAPRQTGVTFANTITVSDSVNVLTNPYVYNGAGVAVADIDNDGLPDIFLAGNMVSSRLYLNKGNMRFEDITQAAGVATHGWVSGVSIVDINNDGYVDIYLSVSGPPWSTPEQRRNLLFINNGNRSFTESAAQYHIDDSGFTTHAVFLDYDRDGDLDLFLLGNSPRDLERRPVRTRCRGERLQPGWLAGPVSLERRCGRGRALHQQPRRHVCGQNARLAQAHELCGHGDRRRRFQ